MSSIIFLMLPVMAFAYTEVKVSGYLKLSGDFPYMYNINVYPIGENVNRISDKERDTFKISKDKLKDCVEVHFGRRPDEAYLFEEEKYGSLYHTGEYKEVVRNLQPKYGHVTKIHGESQIISEQTFENNGTEPIALNISIFKTIEDNVTSFWTKSGEISVKEETNYKFDFEVLDVSNFTLNFTSVWGKEIKKTQASIFGTPSLKLNTTVDPGQSVTIRLHAKRISMKVTVVYVASLSGETIVRYLKACKGKNHWFLDIDKVMESCHLTNNLESTEEIDLAFYTNVKLQVNNKSSGVKIVEVDLEKK